MSNRQLIGGAFAIAAFLSWGLLPMYWKALDAVGPIYIVSHRAVWSFIFLLLVVVLTKRMNTFKSLLTNPFRLGWTTFAAALIAANWGIYIYAVNSNQLLDASLGYYLNPLLNVVLGVLFLGEPLIDPRESRSCRPV